MSVEAAEARSRQRLVDRREMIDPRIPAGDLCSVLGEQLWKSRIAKTGEFRAAAMMQEPGDGHDPTLPDAFEKQIRPAPIWYGPGVDLLP